MTIDLRPDIELITHLDFDIIPACEHQDHEKKINGHTGDAWCIVERIICGTHKQRYIYLCKNSWDYAHTRPMYFVCGDCPFWGKTVEEVWRFVSIIGSKT